MLDHIKELELFELVKSYQPHRHSKKCRKFRKFDLLFCGKTTNLFIDS